MKEVMKKLMVLKILAMLVTIISLGGIPAWAQTNWNVPGDGSNTCTPANPSCNTIQEAVDAASSGDAIGIVGLYVENVIIEKNLILLGDGTDNTIVGGTQSGEPVFKITGATVTLAEMTIADGDGGGISSSSATVTIENSTISGNLVFEGGGINNDGGMMTITGSTISANSATGGGGGIVNSNDGTLTITNSTINSNMAEEGGGIVNSESTITITDSTINGNSAMGSFGGGILNFSGTVTIENSTIGSNMSDGGGGIFNDSGTMTITNSTINGNSAGSSGVGGGITNDGGTMAIEFSTISGNTASEGGGIRKVGMLVELSNSIVANNPSGGDCAGNITSQGYNIDSDNSCSLTAVGDLPNTNPLLGTLQNNGGPTETQALLTGSPAIDAGNPDCPPPATDQRGVTRPQGTQCDIGAFELQVSPGPNPKNGSNYSIASAGSTPTIPLYLLIPVFIAIKKVWRRKKSYSKTQHRN